MRDDFLIEIFPLLEQIRREDVLLAEAMQRLVLETMVRDCGSHEEAILKMLLLARDLGYVSPVLTSHIAWLLGA